MKNELDPLPTDKRQRFLQIAIIILGVWSGMPKIPKMTHISTLWASTFPTRLMLSLLMGIIKHSQITQSSKLAISLQYLK